MFWENVSLPGTFYCEYLFSFFSKTSLPTIYHHVKGDNGILSNKSQPFTNKIIVAATETFRLSIQKKEKKEENM